MKECERNGGQDPQIAALVERARAGDQDAYTALYEKTEKVLFRTIRAMVRTEDEALDIQQDAYVQAFTHLDQLAEPAKFCGWLRSIAVNQTRMALRKQTPVLFTELEDGAGNGLPEQADLSPEASPELSLERKESAALVREILDELTPGQRMLVGMYYYEQLPMGTIAEELGVTLGTVKSQLYHGRKRIETAVRRLEQRGIKLYGLSPLPFLLALMKGQNPGVGAERAVLAKALEEAGVTAAGTAALPAARAAAPAAETVALRVGRRFFETAAGKLMLGVVAVAVISGGAAVYRWGADKLDKGPAPLLLADSNEDLTDAPTVPVASEEPRPSVPEYYADTPEDLSTEPEATEPESTAPDPTEPDQTEPRPADPTPGPGDTERPSEGAQPTDPGPAPSTELPTEPPKAELLDYDWGTPGTRELYDVPWDSPVYLQLAVSGDEAPSVSTDRTELLSLEPHPELNYQDQGDGTRHYFWVARISGAGTAHVYCRLGGEVRGVLTVVNPEYEEKILESYWNFDRANTADSLSIRKEAFSKGVLTALVQGKTQPTLTVENESVARISLFTPFEGTGVSWLVHGYDWELEPVGPGTTKLYLRLNGTLIRTLEVTVTEPEAASVTIK